MLLSIFEKHRSSLHLKGVLENVLVKVRNFIIPKHFIVLEFEEDREIPILLDKSFLATSRSTIDLEKNELSMKINGEIENFKCCHQMSEKGMRKSGEHCKKLFIFNLPNQGTYFLQSMQKQEFWVPAEPVLQLDNAASQHQGRIL
ncbi:Transposon Ty3-I Gag-Pol polyprotein [Gossypium australe]|uniref:Transposon Ty3-I Gag-Pol polyprotein n=1 Tax=Gossypium australe TaxID=47621 RepID=A0A5B6VP83_9ROSI|nr:Transposon Ty3-I Gag-Pol polyprotein [Gossypium australe]